MFQIYDNMKRVLFFIFSLWFSCLYAQEKKPTIMLLPSDHWCAMRYFTCVYEDQGNSIIIPDYQKAFREDTEIGPVFSQIGQILTDLGYSLKDSKQELRAISNRSVEDDNTMSKSGSLISESPLDLLKRSSKSDIIIQVGWQINQESGGKSVSFTIEAFDAYTSKRIATATGISDASKDLVPKILFKAVKKQIKPFDKQLTNYFQSLQENGREIILTVKRWDSWEYDLETSFEGEELIDIIQEWISDNTISGNFNLSDATENIARFEQVRIPLYDEKGKALDARGFATNLRKYLQRSPFNITSKVMMRGLGEAIIVLGEK